MNKIIEDYKPPKKDLLGITLLLLGFSLFGLALFA